MAGHSHASNVKRRKEGQDAKRSLSFTKLTNNVYIAAKSGSDPDLNPHLSLAISKAQSESVPKEKIKNAINRAINPAKDKPVEEIRYNGNLHGIAFIIETCTENKNRTIANIRHVFTKKGGNIVSGNSVEFMFDHIGIIKYKKHKHEDINSEEIFEDTVQAGAENFYENDEEYIIETNLNELHNIFKKLPTKYGKPDTFRPTWKAKNKVLINEEERENIQDIIDKLDQDDDVSEVYHNAQLD